MPKYQSFFSTLLAISLLLSIASAGTEVQAQSSERIDKAGMARNVKAAFRHAWQGYREYAWGHDELKPLAKEGHDWYGVSLYMTPVDAYDTMRLMGLDKESAEAKKLILDRLDFNQDIYVSNFEITIRMLGGLLSAYQLDGDPRFLQLAEDLADRQLKAFDSPTGMPYKFVNLKTGDVRQPVNSVADIGTLMLEFGTLSKLTGDDVYYNTAKHAVQQVYQRRSAIGLVGSTINVETGEWVNTQTHISGLIDSYYEYLLKSWKLFDDPDFKTMWDHSIKAVNTHLADTTDTGFWYGRGDMRDGKVTRKYFGALDAFFPAVLALSGDMDRAAQLEASCFKMWDTFGIEPEVMDYTTMEAVSKVYVLRPENIESAYYLYFYTRDEKYLKRGAAMFTSLQRYCRTDAGYAGLEDVTKKEKKRDLMHSFFLAETLKYAWLLFSDQQAINPETVVFNTEAHPLRKTW